MSDFLNNLSNNDNAKNNVVKQEFPIESKGIKLTEHSISIDKNYNKNKIIKTVVITVSVAIIIALAWIFIWSINRINVMSFTAKTVTEAQTWALKNGIELDISEEYNNDFSSNQVIIQSPNSGKLSKGDIVQLTVSKGADPNEKVDISNLENLTLSEIQTFISDNQLTKTKTTKEYNDDIEKDKVISLEFTTEGSSIENFKRSDSLNIYISLGVKESEKIIMTDFTGKAKSVVESWAEENSINVTYKEVYSDTISKGMVCEQSIASDSEIEENSSVEISISKGNGITVPSYSTVAKKDASTYTTGLQVQTVEKYSTTIAYGKLISQSIAQNSVVDSGEKIVLTYSIGKPYIGNLVGKSEKDLEEYFFDLQSKGTTISYNIEYVDSNVEKGKVVSMSPYNEYIATNQVIYIQISNGNKIVDQSTASVENSEDNDQTSTIIKDR